jgi:plasmid stabilization system protein ParE
VKVRFTPRALAQAKRRKSWWLENRPAAPELFDLELSAARSTLSRNPTLGNVYEAAVGLVVRRLLMKKRPVTCTTQWMEMSSWCCRYGARAVDVGGSFRKHPRRSPLVLDDRRHLLHAEVEVSQNPLRTRHMKAHGD